MVHGEQLGEAKILAALEHKHPALACEYLGFLRTRYPGQAELSLRLARNLLLAGRDEEARAALDSGLLEGEGPEAGIEPLVLLPLPEPGATALHRLPPGPYLVALLELDLEPPPRLRLVRALLSAQDGRYGDVLADLDALEPGVLGDLQDLGYRSRLPDVPQRSAWLIALQRAGAPR